MGDGSGSSGSRLFDTCRRFICDHGKAVVDAGGLEQLQEVAPVTKGLLGDAILEVDRLRNKYEPDSSGGSRKRRRLGNDQEDEDEDDEQEDD